MRTGLFLDDVRNPEDVTKITYPNGVEWTVVRSFKEFLAAIEQDYAVFSFDYILEDFKRSHTIERTGYDCLSRLIYKLMDVFDDKGAVTIPEVFYHTEYDEGKEQMISTWQGFLRFIE